MSKIESGRICVPRMVQGLDESLQHKISFFFLNLCRIRTFVLESTNKLHQTENKTVRFRFPSTASMCPTNEIAASEIIYPTIL